MKKSVQIVILSVFVIGFIAIAAILYPKLPAQMPMQWGIDGKVNYTLPKLPVVAIMIIVASGFSLYTGFIHRAAERIPNKDFVTSLIFPILFSIILVATQIRF